MKKTLLIITLFLSSLLHAKIITLSVNAPDPRYGVFSTYYLKVEPLNDKSNRVRLLEDLIFIDSTGKKWTSPKGSVVDGATIPKAFQGIIGTPYGGEYVLASVIHDVAYDEKKESWEEVHRGFYDALLASGVEANKASLMYMAVYEGSERWGENQDKHLSQEEVLNLFGVDESTRKEIENMLGNLLQGLNI
ncbi:MAG TPA: DUF1353 domain-containing protein [Campylobacterales bacterium]|nr:DUF1353 domain-containing protein [Campylobacterales bacterium]